jgi:hydrogenase maturation factor HypF (carbamoyltransferase family)
MLPESKNDAAQLVRDEAKKGADIINLENQRILDEENYTTDYALQTERERIRYEAELAAANKSGADTTLITAKHALAKEKIEENLQASKVAALGASLGIVSDILGKESAAGKAAALAQAVINTYQGITAGIAWVSSSYTSSSSNCSWFWCS